MTENTRNIQQVDAEIDDLHAQLDRLVQEKASLREAAKKAVVPEYWWLLQPGTESDYRHADLLDPAVKVYRLEGICYNADEAEAVGHRVQTGGMSYLFNTATNKFIGSFTGGTVWIGSFKNNRDPEALRTFEELAAYVTSHPEGGNVTHIVGPHRDRMNKTDRWY